MVDREARETLRHGLIDLATGVIHGDEFTDLHCYRGPQRDPAISKLARWAWCLYSDDQEQRLQFDALPKEVQETLRRSDLFLRSDLEYEWPPAPGFEWGSMASCFFPGVLLILVAAKLYGEAAILLGTGALASTVILFAFTAHFYDRATLRHDRATAKWKARGDHAVWPFFRAADHEREFAARRDILTPAPAPSPPAPLP